MEDNEFEILAPVSFNLICFRYKPQNINSETELNRINELLMNKINKTGKIYMTQTKLNGKFTLRFVVAQTNVKEKNVLDAWKLIKEISLTII